MAKNRTVYLTFLGLKKHPSHNEIMDGNEGYWNASSTPNNTNGEKSLQRVKVDHRFSKSLYSTTARLLHVVNTI